MVTTAQNYGQAEIQKKFREEIKKQQEQKAQQNIIKGLPADFNPNITIKGASTGGPLNTPSQNAPSQDSVFHSGDGSVSGLSLHGKEYLGLNPTDVEQILQHEQAKKGGPFTQALVLQNQQKEQQAQRAALLQQIQNFTPAQHAALYTNNPGLLGGLLPPDINLSEAALAGGQSALPGIAAGVAGGAISGAVGGPIGAVGGAILGGVGAFLSGFLGNVRNQQSGLIQSKYQNVQDSITQLNNLVSSLNMGADPAEITDLYQQTVSRVYDQYSELKLQTQGSAAAFGDGTQQLEKFEIFFNPQGGTLSTINAKFYSALANPNPSKVSAQDLINMGYQ